jgi:predicted kinase
MERTSGNGRDARGFVLVNGWPAAGKSTVASAVARRLDLPLLAKDEIKEALMGALGRPGTVAESQRLGRAAVLVMLRAAQRCPGAVLDSTWFGYTRPLVRELPGPIVEVRCVVPLPIARARYRARSAVRVAGHLDDLRSEDELWGRPPQPVGAGPVLTVDTAHAVDIDSVVRWIEAELAS